ncbi:MAG: prohead protease/major capsid protein fusion protein [Kofleriaceae bacterium]
MPKLSLRASFDSSTVDVEKRTVKLTWTTGARVLRGWFDTYWEELSLDPEHVRMGRLQSGAAPLLNAHRSYDIADVIGVVEDAKLEADGGSATVRFDTGPEAEDAFRKVRERILRNVSVGYSTFKMQKIEDGETTIPVYRAVDWEPYEISMVPIGADAGAVTRSGGGMNNPCEFIQERDMSGLTPSPAPAPAPVPQPAAADQRSAAELEQERILGIQRVGRALKRPEAEIDDAIKKNTPLADYRAVAQDAWAAADTIPIDKRDPRLEVGAEDRDKFLRCAEHLIFQRAGVANMVVEHAKARGETLVIDPGECRGMTMAELAREFLERSGVKARGMDRVEMVGRAFMQRGGGSSTGDFPVLLENALHKTLLAAYATTPDTWRRFCKKGTVTDFRPHPRYRQGGFGVLETVNEGGEFTNAPIPDAEKQAISAGTKGRIVAITRRAIIDDDMGAFSDIATRLGRAAALTIEVDVYKLLVANPTMGDGLPLFHANHGNIGAAGAISVAAVDADRVLMAQQLDPSKNEILELRPAVLVLPVGLGGQARVINQSQYDTDKVANARSQEPNKVVGLYRDIVDTARLTGTTRYSFADPAINPVFEVAFLNGIEAPYMEMQQGWRIDGTEWKVRLDFGVGAVDWRGVVRSPGA